MLRSGRLRKLTYIVSEHISTVKYALYCGVVTDREPTDSYRADTIACQQAIPAFSDGKKLSKIFSVFIRAVDRSLSVWYN